MDIIRRIRSTPATLALLLSSLATCAPSAHAASDVRTFMGYTGSEWSTDFGVTRGRCDRKAVQQALADPGTATPGASPVAVLAGVDLEDADRACAGQALELARNRRTVTWSAGSRKHSLSTGADAVAKGMPCRPFVLHSGGRTTRGLACQAQRGVWEYAGR